MLNILIAYDNDDMSLGEYFLACFKDIQHSLNLVDKINLISLKGNECTTANIEYQTKNFDNNKFVF